MLKVIFFNFYRSVGFLPTNNLLASGGSSRGNSSDDKFNKN